MTRLRLKGSARQRAWDRLRKGPVKDAQTLANEVDSGRAGIAAWVKVLRDHGYFAADVDQIVLLQNTGPIAPAVSVKEGRLQDWNVNPPMDPSRLKAVINRFDEGPKAWLDRHGFHPNGISRFYQMIDGKRAISDEIASAVEADEAGGVN
ncbi:MAG: hypothetical protein AAFX52_11200 [Pseudomonadota bacterium]